MLRRSDSLFAPRRRFLLVAASLPACLVLGCAKPLPPEHVKAISKMQGLGGKVMFEEGGYRLNLADTRVTDEDLDVLADIQDLKVLDLRNTQVTDVAIDKLIPLKSLILVIVTRSHMTPEGIDRLSKARPELNISN